MPQAAAGIRIEPPVSVPTVAERHAGRDARGRSAARAARRSRRVVRIAGGAERRVLVGRAERELVQVGLADEDRAGLAQARDRRRVAGRRRGRRARATRRSSASPRMSNRSLIEIGTPCSGPRSRPAASSRSASRGCLPRLVGHHEDERVQPRVVGARCGAGTRRSCSAALISRRAAGGRTRRWSCAARGHASQTSAAGSGAVD